MQTEFGKEICEQQTKPAMPAGGKTTLTHLLASPSSTASPCKSSSSSSLTSFSVFGSRCLRL